MFKVALEVDGVVTESRTFDVRADPALPYTPKDHKARVAFVEEVMALQLKVDALAKDLSARRAVATGDEVARLQALELRLVGGGLGGRGGGGGGRGGGGPQAIRQRLTGLAGTYNISGAQTGTLAPPTVSMLTTLAEVKSELAKLEREISSASSAR